MIGSRQGRGEDTGPAQPAPSPQLRLPVLAGRRALVTGASSGIGRATAARLAHAGAAVLATGRDRYALEALAKEVDSVGLALHHQPADLTDPDDRAHLVEAVHGHLGALSILVHSAGVYRRGATAEASLTDLDEAFAVNVHASYALTQMLLPDLMNTHGDIMFVNSTQGLSAGAGVGQYAATKHALRAIADSIRAEVADAGVRVCSVFPGRTATPMQQQIFLAEGREWNPDLLIQPDDIAGVVTFALAVPDRAEITEIMIRPTRRL
jgi:NADP-dependent 3-hydroxy acid dehydrogenase YdfG